MRSERFDFPGGAGHRLAARLDLPDGAPRAQALFAHCFTCGKDSPRRQPAVSGAGGGGRGDVALRFHRPGRQRRRIRQHRLRLQRRGPDRRGQPPARAGRPPVDPDRPQPRRRRRAGRRRPHRRRCGRWRPSARRSRWRMCWISLPRTCPRSRRAARRRCNLAGRPFTIRRDFVDDARSQDQAPRIAALGRALLVMHAPLDQRGRHRQCPRHLRRGEAPEELRRARRRGPPAVAARGRRPMPRGCLRPGPRASCPPTRPHPPRRLAEQ